MRKKRLFALQYSLVMLLVAIVLSGCAGEQQPGPSVEEPAAFATLAPTNTPAPPPTPTATPAPLTLFLSEKLPQGAITLENIGTVNLSDDPAADLWFGPEGDAPSGELLHTASWVYALAAPFPTLADDITLNTLGAYWQGEPAPPLERVEKLYVPEALLPALGDRWGRPDPGRVEVYQNPPAVLKLWDTNAWAILPFEVLEPRLKVISIEGLSPLFKDFDPASYPLSARYQLVLISGLRGAPQNAEIAAIMEAIQPGNRDPERMTTLVMTGVTALVRGTAYRMEMHGVLYPAEKIRDWLTEADLTHISNEVSFYEECPFPDPTSPSLLFCSNPKYIDLLAYVGADIIELTGNHNNDALLVHGFDAVPYTLDLYDQYGMAYFGGGRDMVEAKSPLLMAHNGNQLAFIGCNAFGPDFAWATAESGGSAPCEDYQWMAEEISRLRAEGSLPIATFQYYEDYYDFAVDHHKRDFGLMAQAGAVIVNGSQAHRPKAMAFEHGGFIDYGLGNLFFDQNWVIDMYGNVIVQTSWEIIQRHTFYNGRHLSTELLTAKLVDYAQPRPMTPQEREQFLTELFTASGWITR